MRPLRVRLALGAALAALLSAARPCPAQGAPEGIPWPLAPLLGTGRYELSDDTSVQSIGYAPRHTFRSASLGAAGRRAGVELRVPLTLTTYRTDLTDLASFGVDDVGTFSAVPGVELDVPLGPRLGVKPLVYLGAGREFDGGPTAAIFWTGLKTRLEFAPGELDLDLVTSLRYAGFATADESGDVVPLRAGLEITKPMRDKRIGGDPLEWHWHVVRTHYLDADAAPGPAPARRVDDEWEIGAAFGKRGKRLRLWRLAWDRVGVAVTLDTSGRPNGFRLVFRSLYDR